MKKITVANASGFWGDRDEAAEEIVKNFPEIDFITFDYLAEVSLSILAAIKAKDNKLGYAKDFLEVLKKLIPYYQKGLKFKLITNGGGLNPKALGLACQELLEKHSIKKQIAVCTGDDVLETLNSDPENPLYNNLETSASFSEISSKTGFATANAYIGARPIKEALDLGAEIVITGRVADPSLCVAAALYSFKWKDDNFDLLSQATVAGHLIECGTQATGGISCRWNKIERPWEIGYPIAEIYEDGQVFITKPPLTQGFVDEMGIKEQLVYEIGDPGLYLSPDVTVSMSSVKVEQASKDRVAISGAKGFAPPATLKVSATFPFGFRLEGQLLIVGENAKANAEKASQMILKRVEQKGHSLLDFFVETFHDEKKQECLLRIAARAETTGPLEYLAKQFAPLVTSGPPGTTGYTSGRSKPRPIFCYWPCLIEKSCVASHVEILA